MRSAATVALEFDSAKLFYFPTPRIIPENPDVTNGFDMSPYTPLCYIQGTARTFKKNCIIKRFLNFMKKYLNQILGPRLQISLKKDNFYATSKIVNIHGDPF